MPDQANVLNSDASGRLERLSFTAAHGRAVATVGAGHFFDGFDALSISFVVPVLIAAWHLSPGQVGLLISVGYLGQFVGAFSLGRLAEQFGRMRTFRATLVIISIFSLACAFSTSFAMLATLRFLQGIGLGAEIPVGGTYINELCPARLRGRIVFVLQCMFSLAVFVTAAVSSAIIPALGWQSVFIIGSLPILIVPLTLAFAPESPRWLASQGRHAEAEAALSVFEQSAARSGENLAPVAAAAPAAARQATRIADLWAPHLRARTLSSWVICFCLAFFGFGLLTWMPTLFRTVYHLPLGQALRLAASQNIVSLLAAVIGFFLIDTLGRRRIFLYAFLGASVPMIVLAFTASGLPPTTVRTLSAVTMFFASLMNISVFLYVGEVYPTHLRATGAGAASAWFRMGAILSPIATAALLAHGSIGAVFGCFAFAALVGAVTVFLFMVETRGRRLEEITDQHS